MIDKINIQEKFALISDYWNPRIAGELNGQMIKLVKFKGEFIWHKHEYEDEMFFVVNGKFIMELRDKSIELQKGDFIIVPRGVEHKPSADEEVEVMLFEPASTLNTGDKKDTFTKTQLEKI